jgi:hypothetical protein
MGTSIDHTNSIAFLLLSGLSVLLLLCGLLLQWAHTRDMRAGEKAAADFQRTMLRLIDEHNDIFIPAMNKAIADVRVTVMASWDRSEVRVRSTVTEEVALTSDRLGSLEAEHLRTHERVERAGREISALVLPALSIAGRYTAV